MISFSILYLKSLFTHLNNCNFEKKMREIADRRDYKKENGGKMTIKDAVAEIIRLKGKDIFKDKKIFFALLGDLAPEYPKELKIIRNNFDEDIFKLFIDENKKNSHKVRLFYSSLDDLGVAEDKIYFFLESFGIPLGWEQEILDFKADSPMQVPNYDQQSTKQSGNENVTDISLSEDILKQWGFVDKNSIPAVLNIPSTYKSPFGTIRITKIDNELFKDCDKLQSVTIPDTVTEIVLLKIALL